MLKVQKQAKTNKKIQDVTLSNLRQQLAETTGIFKGKERKAPEKQLRPPTKQSVLNDLKQLQAESKQNYQPKQRKKSQDRDR